MILFTDQRTKRKSYCLDWRKKRGRCFIWPELILKRTDRKKIDVGLISKEFSSKYLEKNKIHRCWCPSNLVFFEVASSSLLHLSFVQLCFCILVFNLMGYILLPFLWILSLSSLHPIHSLLHLSCWLFKSPINRPKEKVSRVCTMCILHVCSQKEHQMTNARIDPVCCTKIRHSSSVLLIYSGFSLGPVVAVLFQSRCWRFEDPK